jgi:hypothetical protein
VERLVQRGMAGDPEHPLNRSITDIGLAWQYGDEVLVHFSADFRILMPFDPGRGNHRLLFDVGLVIRAMIARSVWARASAVG